MAVTADRVIVELEAKLDRYEANVRRAEQKFDSATRAIAGDARRMEREIAASTGAVGNQFKRLAATVGAAFSAQQVAQLADTYTRFTNQLKVAGLEGQNLADVGEKLFAVAQRNGTELESLGTLYSKAAQNQRELSASTADLLVFNRAVAASLRISGTSAANAAGPLLQLGQALGSPRVMAEEFNSVLEGMPTLLREASKFIDGTGGTLAGLTRKIKDLNGPGVSNVELFKAITQAMAQLETTAGKTTLTISGAFTNLSNALTKYIGEADQANGASVAITGALDALANNLDTVVEALSVLAAVMVGRFVSSAVASTSALVAQTIAANASAASFNAMTLQSTRAVGAMGALAIGARGAGAALLGAFGGPVGLAVTALAVGIGLLVQKEADAKATAESLSESIDAQAAAFSNVTAQQAAANAAADNLDSTQRAALTSTANLTGEASLLAQAWGRVATQAKLAALEQARAAASTARTNAVLARSAVNQNATTQANRPSNQPNGSPVGAIGRGVRLLANTLNPGRQAGIDAEAQRVAAQDKTAQDNLRLAEANLRAVETQSVVDFKQAPVSAASTTGKGSKKSAGATGPSADDIARRFEDELARAELEIRAAQAQAIGTAQARRDFELLQIEDERARAARDIAADDKYSAAQKEKLLALNDSIAANRRAAVKAAGLEDGAQQSLDIQTAELADAQDLLRLRAGLADTAKDRRDIELRILDLQYQEEKLRLEALAVAATATEAEKEIAKRRLAELDTAYDLRRQGTERQNEGPLAKYRRSATKSSGQIQEQAEQWVVDELENVQSTLSNAIQKKLGVQDPILAGVLDLFIEQVILKPLADAFAGASGGGGGIGGAIASIGAAIFGGGGRASGGHVVAGNMYRVNETGIEGFKPSGSGQIIPLGRMRSASGGNVTIQQTVKVDARNSVTPDGFADYIVERTRQETTYIVGEANKRMSKAVPGRMAQFQRDGT